MIKVLKSSSMKSDEGYCKLPDGTLICWGQYNSKGEDYLINFQVPFTGIYYGFSTVPIYYHFNYHAVLHSMNLKFCKLSFKNFEGNDSIGDIVGRWMAIGRWK